MQIILFKIGIILMWRHIVTFCSIHSINGYIIENTAICNMLVMYHMKFMVLYGTAQL